MKVGDRVIVVPSHGHRLNVWEVTASLEDAKFIDIVGISDPSRTMRGKGSIYFIKVGEI